MNTQFIKVPMIQPTALEELIDAGEAFVAQAQRLDIPVVVGIAAPDQVYITAHTNMLTPDTLYRLITSLSPRQHPSVLTMPIVENTLKRIEQDAQDLEDAGVPFVFGIQPEPQGKLKILSSLPDGSMQSLHSAHLDMTITNPDMYGPTEEVPCP